MTFTLPTDEQIERELAEIRVSVLEATHHTRSPRRSTRYRTTRAIIIAGAAAAILTAGTIVAIQASQEEQDTWVRCYQEASLESQVANLIYAPEPENPDWQLLPVEMCSIIWANDSFGPGGNNDPDAPGAGTHPVPDLVVCTLPDGVTGVFPRENDTTSDKDFCAALGLADWGSD